MRDIETLKNEYNAPIEYDAVNRGYFSAESGLGAERSAHERRCFEHVHAQHAARLRFSALTGQGQGECGDGECAGQ